MKTNNNKLLIGALVVAALGFNSCKKEEAPILNKATYQAKIDAFQKTSQKQLEANVHLYSLATEVLPNLIEQTKEYMVGKTSGDKWDCAIVSIDSSVSPRVATIDFGTGCTNSNGKFASGKVIVSYNNESMKATGAHLEATFDNFGYDGKNVNGTLVFDNLGPNGSGNVTGTISLNLQTEFIRDRMQINGSTNMSFENISARKTTYINISGTGIDKNGLSYTQTTTTRVTLNRTPGCSKHFVSGVMLLQTQGLPDEEIDYGTGTCDDLATSTINGVATTFTLE